MLHKECLASLGRLAMPYPYPMKMRTVVLRICLAILISTAALSLPAEAIAQEKKVQQIKGWGEVVDPDGDCKVVEEKGNVTITIPGTHHNLNPTRAFMNLSAPRILQEVGADFLMHVTMLPFPRPLANMSSNMRNSYLGAGLLIWHDGNAFLRFLRAANGETGLLFASAELYKDGVLAGSQNVQLQDRYIYFRLERRKSKFIFSVSEDDQK